MGRLSHRTKPNQEFGWGVHLPQAWPELLAKRTLLCNTPHPLRKHHTPCEISLIKYVRELILWGRKEIICRTLITYYPFRAISRTFPASQAAPTCAVSNPP